MARLRDVAKLIRSKNAGPFSLTIDILFKDGASYERVRDAKVLNARLFAEMFRLSENQVRVFNYDPAHAVKVTVPRFVTSGDIADPDIFGGQQYAPLVDLEVPG